MNLLSINEFVATMRERVEEKQWFSIDREGEEFSLKQLKFEEFFSCLQSVAQFSEWVLEEIAIQDFHHLRLKEMESIIEIVRFLKFFVQKVQGRVRGKEAEKFIKLIKECTFALSLGGKISLGMLQKIDPVMRTFLEINEFPEKCLFLRLQLQSTWDQGILLPVEVENGLYQSIPIDDIQRAPWKKNRSKGFQFYYGDLLLFESDNHLRLLSHYTLLSEGITHYHPTKSPILRRTLINPPEDGLRPNRITFQFTGWWQNHLSLLLKCEDGSLYSIGIQGERIASPDEVFFQTLRENPKENFEIEISARKMRAVLHKLEKARANLSATYTQYDLCEMIAEALNIPCAPKISSFKDGCFCWEWWISQFRKTRPLFQSWKKASSIPMHSPTLDLEQLKLLLKQHTVGKQG